MIMTRPKSSPIAPDARARTDERLAYGRLAAYSVGGSVDSICSFFLTTLLYFYLTAVCGLTGAAAGSSLAVALVVDAVVDPLVGSISDNSNSHRGRRQPFMLAAAIPAMVALGLLFSIPSGFTGIFLLVYATALCLILRVSMSFFNVPYIALGAELTDDYQGRTSVVLLRFGVGTISAIAPIILAYGVFLSGHNGLLNRTAYVPLAWICGGIVAVAALAAGGATLGAGLKHEHRRSHKMSMRRFLGEIDEVRRNSTFMLLFLSSLIFSVSSGMSSAMQIHAATYFWNFPVGALQTIGLSAILGLLVGLPIVQVLSPFLEKRTIVLLGLIFFCTAQVVPVLLRMTASPVASAGNAVPLVTFATFLVSVGVTAVIVGVQSMMADAIDEHEYLFRARREGLFFAGFSFSQKASSGLGVFLAGLGMDAIGFPHALANSTHPLAIPHETIQDLGLLIGPGTAGLSILGGILLLGYRLNREVHAQILQGLAQRSRSTTTPQPVPEQDTKRVTSGSW